MRDKSLVPGDIPFLELHQFINNVPLKVLKEGGWVDQDFDLAEHNEIWEECYPIRNRDPEAMAKLSYTCLGKKVRNDKHAENV